MSEQTERMITYNMMCWYSPTSLNSTAGDILKGNSDERTWLASSTCCLYTSGEQRAYFVLLTAYSTAIHENYLISSKGYTIESSWGISPVISVNIKLINFAESGKNGSTSSTAWNLK